MVKREIPLFIIDRTRQHKKGECDFLVCTDKDNGFIARMNYIDGEVEEVGDDYRTGIPNGGVSLKIQIVRMTGVRPTKTAIRTLLKAAMEYYGKFAHTPLNIDNPSCEECAQFLGLLIEGNMANLNTGTPSERRTTQMAIKMLQASHEYLSKMKSVENGEQG